MNTTAKGNRFEREIAQLFRDAGYTVTKARVSRGVFDLFAYSKGKNPKRWAIQCKVGAKPTRSELKRFFLKFKDILYKTTVYERVWVCKYKGNLYWYRIPLGLSFLKQAMEYKGRQPFREIDLR